MEIKLADANPIAQEILAKSLKFIKSGTCIHNKNVGFFKNCGRLTVSYILI